MPLTVQQYHRMIAEGILQSGEPYELLDGYLVRKDRSKAGGDLMTVGPDHAKGIKLVSKLAFALTPFNCHLQIQLPITIEPDGEPEPDAAIVRGSIDDYNGRHPGPDDVICAFEIADSSLSRDRTTKQRIYCDAGIAQYTIVNLIDGVVELYTRPLVGHGKYDDVRPHHRGETLRLTIGEGQTLDVAVDALLP